MDSDILLENVVNNRMGMNLLSGSSFDKLLLPEEECKIGFGRLCDILKLV
jgi:hypothetical protein